MKRFLFSIFVMFNFSFLLANEYNISVKNVEVSSVDKNKLVSIELGYNMKNTGKETVYLYDLRVKSECHYEEDFYSEHTALKKIYVFKPITKDSWTASWSYSPWYPEFIKVMPGESCSGTFNLKFKIPLDVNPYKIDYEFNFLLSTCDIRKYLANFDSNEITEKYLHNETVRFRLKWFHREILLRIMKILNTSD